MVELGPRTPSGLSSLLMLADGRLPAGGHANSGGVEWAAQWDNLLDPAELQAWIEARLETIGRVEAAFAVAASETGVSDGARWSELDAELDARLVGPRAQEVSRQMGRQFSRLARRAWPGGANDMRAHPAGPHMAMAFGGTCGSLSLAPVDTAALMLHHLVASMVTATVRLAAADPIELAAVQVRCGHRIEQIAADASAWAVAQPSQLPSRSMPLAELLTEDHGTWTSRLFVA